MPRQFGKVDRDSVSDAWSCDKCRYSHSSGVACPAPGVWLATGLPTKPSNVVWLKRPMPDGQWPVDQSLPRDDSFSWWVRSYCGHQGGARQWAFYEERYANTYEHVFRANPCRYTNCAHSKIENNRRLSRG